MSSGGLGQSDIGTCPDKIGGFAKEFYTRNRNHYANHSSTVGGNARRAGGNPGCRLPAPHCNQTFNLEPHVALSIFETMLKEANVDVLYGSQVVDVGMVQRQPLQHQHQHQHQQQRGRMSGPAGANTIASITLTVEAGGAKRSTGDDYDHHDLATRPVPSLRTASSSAPASSSSAASTNRTVYGKVFIDAGYEGDLLARAGASFVTGREAGNNCALLI